MRLRPRISVALLMDGRETASDDLLSIVRFNTACARRHEVECSGRLSFALEPEAAVDHVRRHAGEVTDTAAQDLYDALARIMSISSCWKTSVLDPMPHRIRSR